MSRILFLNQPSIGHLNTLLSIASQMKEDGHEVSFLVPGIMRSKMNTQNLGPGGAVPYLIQKNDIAVNVIRPHFSLAVSAIILPFMSGYNETVYALDMFSKGIVYYTKSILKAIESNKPDIMVSDFTFFASSVAAELISFASFLMRIVDGQAVKLATEHPAQKFIGDPDEADPAAINELMGRQRPGLWLW